MLAMAAVVPLSGWSGDRYSARPVYVTVLAALAGDTLGCMGVALAQRLVMLGALKLSRQLDLFRRRNEPPHSPIHTVKPPPQPSAFRRTKEKALRQRRKGLTSESGKRGLNPRPQPWQRWGRHRISESAVLCCLSRFHRLGSPRPPVPHFPTLRKSDRRCRRTALRC